jgi:hypothetical protein
MKPVLFLLLYGDGDDRSIAVLVFVEKLQEGILSFLRWMCGGGEGARFKSRCAGCIQLRTSIIEP